MRIVPKSDRSGFTLVELLVTVALAIIIVGIVVVAFAQGGGVFTLAHAKIEAIHSAQVALDFLERDIRSALDDQPFIGVVDISRGQIDNDDDGLFDEGGDTYGVRDPVDFLPTAGQERHGLEFVSASMFATDEQGQPVPAVHVLYYLTRDGTTERDLPTGSGNYYETGRLIRYTSADLTDTHWLDPAHIAGWPSVGLEGQDSQDSQTLAFGITQFQLRYYSGGQWYDTWTKVGPAPGDPLPQAVEVTLRVVDSDASLDKPNRNPVVMRRLIPIPVATAP